LTPDLIQIAGNMTTTEQFDVQLIPQTNTACAAGGTKISLSPNAPAIVRTFGGTVPTAGNAASLGLILQNLFAPDQSSSFLLRLVDKTAHTQYLATCPVASGQPSAGVDSGLQPYVLVDGVNTPILFAKATGTNVSTIGGVSGFCAGCTVNPVQIVQWEITTNGGADNEPSAYNNLGYLSLTKTADTAKYDLMRSYLSSTGTLLPATSEIVGEYAVDLAFAFTGDSGTSLAPAVTSATSACAFDDTACNKAWAQQAYAVVAPQGPQRIRTARARLTTRTAQADRSVSVPLAPAEYPAGSPFQTFLYRYNVPSPAQATPLKWARARTITAEVALSNQARNFY
jgi:hypothetical protein